MFRGDGQDEVIYPQLRQCLKAGDDLVGGACYGDRVQYAIGDQPGLRGVHAAVLLVVVFLLHDLQVVEQSGGHVLVGDGLVDGARRYRGVAAGLGAHLLAVFGYGKGQALVQFDFGRVAPGRAGAGFYVPDGITRQLRVGADLEQHAVGDAPGQLQGLRAGAGDDHRHLARGPAYLQVRAVVVDLFACHEAPHRVDDLFHAPEPGRPLADGEHRAVPDADAQHSAASGVFIQGGETVRQYRGVAGDDIGDAGRQFHVAGALRKQGQGHEGIAEHGLGVCDPDAAEPQGLGAGYPVNKVGQGPVGQDAYVE